MSPQFFDNADLFLNSVKTCNRSHYLTVPAIIQLGRTLNTQNYYINWYECGFLHEKDGKQSYEGWDTWGKIYPKIDTQEQLETNNLKAFQEIKIDIVVGHTAFCVSVKELSF